MSQDIMEEIISKAGESNDIAEFGKAAIQILFENKLIDEAVYEILMGK